MSNHEVKKESGQSSVQSGEKTKKGKRYQGYDVEKTVNKRSGRKKPWFWKVLGISLILTAVIVAGACTCLFLSNKKMTDYISQINGANTMSALLEDHENVRITCTYSHLTEGQDYTTTRLVKTGKKGEYYSYLKKEGSEEDYKEVIDNQKMYRYDEKFVHFYGLVGTDYEDVCVADIEGNVYQASGTEKIDTQKENGNVIKIRAVYDVKDGDEYTKIYGFHAGDKIEKTLTLDKSTMFVMSASESNNDEEFYSYTVEFNVEEKVPQFYKDLKKVKDTRKCYVYYDYDGDQQEKYSFELPYDVYFALLDHEGYKVYMNKECTTEFSDYQRDMQNPEGTLTLYMKK